eukprot:TRINITY_DN1179_c0_g1_i2.p1 TRINITY_DN1179_c0_g1~~TRINITY_DN1179_c0_g1_i2.p1  ORF type:complete len:539 (-),score=114.74 TRINITY_DN1179_c0_g1_i2:1388-3004(-)
MKFALFALAVIAAGAVAISPPVFPKQFYVEGIFSLPYAGIREPVRMMYDGVNHREYFDFYEGLDGSLSRLDEGQEYEMFIMKDRRACIKTASTPKSSLVSLFPDFTGWTYQGTKEINHLVCDYWQMVDKEQEKVNTYNFYSYYLSDKNTTIPVRYSMLAYDSIFGSHYDEYVLDYGIYLPNFVDTKAFDIPEECKHPVNVEKAATRVRRSALQVKQMIPHQSAQKTVDWVMNNKKSVLSSHIDVPNMLSQHLEMIRAHNDRHDQGKETFRMSLNRFAGLSEDEFRALMLPSSGKRIPNNAHHTYKKMVPAGLDAVPTSIDWRDKGAVTAVKDQGVCGSCWTFGTTGTIEGAYKLKTGKLQSFSEQQLVDCGWTNKISDFDNNGCGGGLEFLGVEYIMRVGGLQTEESYPYIMQDDYCHFDPQKAAVRVNHYVNVTEGDEQALQEAVALYGPISVGINVQSSFIFYSSGVYYDANCKSGFADLEHAVLVAGYGTENGQDYWLVKNSWSTHWGDDGYVKMARNRNNNCGIATNALYVVLE